VDMIHRAIEAIGRSTPAGYWIGPDGSGKGRLTR
jgi:hypothetical protein